jgi:hypothetical protein
MKTTRLPALLIERESLQRARDSILPGTNPVRVRALNKQIGALTVRIEAAKKLLPIHDPAAKDGVYLRPPGSKKPAKLGPARHRLHDDLKMELRSGMWCYYGSGLPAYSFRVDCDKETAGAILRDLRRCRALVSAVSAAAKSLDEIAKWTGDFGLINRRNHAKKAAAQARAALHSL